MLMAMREYQEAYAFSDFDRKDLSHDRNSEDESTSHHGDFL